MAEKPPPSNSQYDPPPPYAPQQDGMPGSVGGAPYGDNKGQPPPVVITNQPHYQPQQPVYGQPGTTTVVVTAPMMGPYPINMVCPKCQAQIVTETRPITGLLTWLVAGGLCLVGCWIGCCLIPFCVDELQDCEHRCPNCKQYIGTYKRM